MDQNNGQAAKASPTQALGRPSDPGPRRASLEYRELVAQDQDLVDGVGADDQDPHVRSRVNIR